MPSWDGIDVQEEPHDLDASIKRRSSAPPVEEAEDEETQEDENLDFYHMDALSDSSIDHSTIRRVGQRVDAPPIIVPDVTSSDPNQVDSSSALRKVTTNKPSDVAQGARENAQPQGVEANKDNEDDGINKVFEDANEGKTRGCYRSLGDRLGRLEHNATESMEEEEVPLVDGVFEGALGALEDLEMEPLVDAMVVDRG
nr:hypothetical protein [Tanacetum cinerariifolium]